MRRENRNEDTARRTLGNRHAYPELLDLLQPARWTTGTP